MSVLFKAFPCVCRKMTTKRMCSRRVEKERVNEENLPQVEQVEPILHDAQDPQGSQVPQGDQVP